MGERDLGRALLAIARSAIGIELGHRSAIDVNHAALEQPGASFVTLKHTGELRGCIGSLRASRPLGIDVRENAIAAAFRDPRFPPLAAGEFATTTIEVSLLSAAEPVHVASEEDLVARLRPGVDGITLEYGRHRATFLPQVWQTLAEPRDFLAVLKDKAGLRRGFWSAGVNVSRYQVAKWAETDISACAEEG